MATNHYFSNNSHQSQQNIVEDVIIESIKIHGMDVYYIMRESNDLPIKRNELFGEDYIGRFKKRYPIEMYLENADGWEGEGDLLAKFGVVLRDTGSFVVSKKRFNQETLTVRPKEGDLLYIPLTNGLFEITFVTDDNPFYQFGKLYTYKLSVELFQYSEEQFDTGIDDIDRISELNAFNVDFSLENIAGLSDFIEGENIYVEGTSFGGTIEDLDGAVHLSGMSGGSIPTTGNMVGVVSGASYGISSANPYEMRTNPFADNDIFQDSGSDIIDDSDPSPYGTY